MCYRCEMLDQFKQTGEVQTEVPGAGSVTLRREEDGKITLTLEPAAMAMLLAHASIGAQVEKELAAFQAQLN